MTNATSGVLEVLGLSADELDWQDLAICKNQPIDRFYRGYETNPRTAMLTDQMCLSCPVRNECLGAGIDNKEWGCWGGIFLVNGKPDETKNSHKTPDIWEEIRQGLS